ncbi:MAG TPA: PIG-L family deacetylase, partial [Pseudomonadales bacterium]|nr:PIG-L family deacetylase [Pseudomonadales bacterium]
HADMRWIYISPHFDDAVLSCGGLIWEQAHSGVNVEIWTICAGDPPPGNLSAFATMLHQKWQTGDGYETVALRRAEDKNAARRVRANPIHLNVPDAIYRRAVGVGPLYTEDIFVPIHPADKAVDEIAAMLAQKLTNYDTVVCPLAVGGHVDHVITRAAVEKLGRPLWYYADIPYFLTYPDKLAPATQRLSSRTFFVSSRGLTAWQNGIAAYASQISSLFADTADMRQKIREYLRQFDGLRLWEAE